MAGYFGCGNYGDDAILLGFLEGVRDLPYEVSVLAKEPERMLRTYGMRAVARFDSSQVKTAIEECDALVFPGGSVFQDVTSVRSVAYYSSLVKQAKKAGKKVVMLGQGVGPLNTWLGKKMASSAFNACDALAVRDPGSLQTLRGLGVRIQPKVTADMAFLLPEPPTNESSGSFGAGGMKTIGVSARPWGKDRSKAVIEVFAALVKMLYGAGMVPMMIEMDESEDRPIIEAISKAHGGKVPDLKGVAGPVPLQQRLARMEAVIAMRLHAGILAATVGVPPFMISYDPKVSVFANLMGLSSPPSMQGLSAQRIFDDFQSFLKTRDRTAEALRRKRDEMAKLAAGNIDVLREAVG